MPVNLKDYICAGYYVSKRVARPSYSSCDLLPQTLLSASQCICNFAPDTWCIEWMPSSKEITRNEKTFGLSSQAVTELTAWATSRMDKDIGWPNVCFTLATAFTIVNRFLNSEIENVVFGLGLHRRFVDPFLECAKPPPPQEGYARVGPQGVYSSVARGYTLEDGGAILGFEPAAFSETIMACSWLCGGFEAIVHNALGVTPNAYGFIDSPEEAFKVVEYLSNDKVANVEGLWFPWLIVEYESGSPKPKRG